MAAMQQMGKLKHPVTDKIERDLKQAKMSIDMLEMLKEKTRGNLNSDEEQLLNRTLSETQLNYVAELKKGESPKEGSEKESEDENEEIDEQNDKS